MPVLPVSRPFLQILCHFISLHETFFSHFLIYVSPFHFFSFTPHQPPAQPDSAMKKMNYLNEEKERGKCALAMEIVVGLAGDGPMSIKWNSRSGLECVVSLFGI